MTTTTSPPPTTTTSPPTARGSSRRVVRRTGLAYLGIIATGIAAEFVIRGSLVVDGDAATTARNIADAPGLFGAGIAADLVMVALDVTVAIGLFRLLRHVDRRRATVAAVLRLVQGVIIAANLVNLAVALGAARDAVASDGSILAGPAADALAAVERHAVGYDVGLLAFALSCVVLGRLLAAPDPSRPAGLVSRRLAHGMVLTGFVYLAGSLTTLFAPDLTSLTDPLYLVPMVVEPAFAVALLRVSAKVGS